MPHDGDVKSLFFLCHILPCFLGLPGRYLQYNRKGVLIRNDFHSFGLGGCAIKQTLWT